MVCFGFFPIWENWHSSFFFAFHFISFYYLTFHSVILYYVCQVNRNFFLSIWIRRISFVCVLPPETFKQTHTRTLNVWKQNKGPIISILRNDDDMMMKLSLSLPLFFCWNNNNYYYQWSSVACITLWFFIWFFSSHSHFVNLFFCSSILAAFIHTHTHTQQ